MPPDPLALRTPQFDPTPIFELFRGSYATELLVAAVAHFRLFDLLRGQPLQPAELQQKLGLADRPLVVLTTALRAMQLLTLDAHGRYDLTPTARQHLVSSSKHFIGDYLGLAADSPGVREMIARLMSNLPAGHDARDGVGFVYRDDLPSAMEAEASARHFTLALAGRAKNVAPVFAQRAPLAAAKLLLDVGGGTGLYSIACLQRFPQVRALVWDRPEVLKIAAEMSAQYGVSQRLTLVPGDMFVDPVPAGADTILLSNILHDWDVPECQTLVHRCAKALPAGGRLLIHDVFLNDALDGPLPIALYSASLFSFTPGRAYSAAEYRAWLTAAGLQPEPIVETRVHCGILAGIR